MNLYKFQKTQPGYDYFILIKNSLVISLYKDNRPGHFSIVYLNPDLEKANPLL